MRKAISAEKAAAIYRLTHDFGLQYKHIAKLIDIKPRTYWAIVNKKGAYK